MTSPFQVLPAALAGRTKSRHPTSMRKTLWFFSKESFQPLSADHGFTIPSSTFEQRTPVDLRQGNGTQRAFLVHTPEIVAFPFPNT
jgi:hypothetical protein